jgi:hypothetical protein
MELENLHLLKLIDVKVFERYFKELNKETPTERNVIEESCDCDWIIFVKMFFDFCIIRTKTNMLNRWWERG